MRFLDGDDFDEWQACSSGPFVPLDPGCEGKELDDDGDVDQSDFGLFQRCLSGQGTRADPDCIE